MAAVTLWRPFMLFSPPRCYGQLTARSETTPALGAAQRSTLVAQSIQNAQTATITSMNRTKTSAFNAQGQRPCNR